MTAKRVVVVGKRIGKRVTITMETSVLCPCGAPMILQRGDDGNARHCSAGAKCSVRNRG